MGPGADFRDRYQVQLSAHIADPGERGRAEAYALGREAIGLGISVLDLIVTHADAMGLILDDDQSSKLREASTEFCLEALSTFDMAQKGYQSMAARFVEEHEMAMTLQRVLLPPAPPTLSGMQVGWRYLPAEARDIGGDWYDVFDLDSGDAVLVIGDVMGHDLKAAAIMGQLRLALQAYALDGYSPAEVVSRSDRLLQRLDPDRLATLIYAVVSPDRRHVRMTNAGHPPPLLLKAEAEVAVLDKGLSVPLGTDLTDQRHIEAGYRLSPGDRLLLYTDGLVEDRSRNIEVGIETLIATVRSDRRSPDEICEAALSVRSSAREDDVCILCAAITPEGG